MYAWTPARGTSELLETESGDWRLRDDSHCHFGMEHFMVPHHLPSKPGILCVANKAPTAVPASCHHGGAGPQRHPVPTPLGLPLPGAPFMSFFTKLPPSPSAPPSLSIKKKCATRTGIFMKPHFLIRRKTKPLKVVE